MSIRRPDAQRAGILGLGRIGSHVARVLAAAGFEVVGYDPFVDAETATERGVRWLPFDDVIATSNILSLHLPLTKENRHLIDAAALAAMPAGSVIVNVSRGGLIDEEALADALASGHLAGAGIDTFETEPLPTDSRLTEFDNVLLSPHAAHFSTESIGEIYAKSMAEVVRVLKGEPPTDRRQPPHVTSRQEPRSERMTFPEYQDQARHRDRRLLRHRSRGGRSPRRPWRRGPRSRTGHLGPRAGVLPDHWT